MTEREEDCRKSKSLEELWEEIRAENKKTYNNLIYKSILI